MLKKLRFIAILLGILFPIFASAQSTNLWFLSSGSVRPNLSTWSLTVPQLGGSGTRCLQVDNNGLFSGAVGSCSSGGIAWPFTKQADGTQATSTTLGFFNGFLSLASSTNLALFTTTNLLLNGSSTLQTTTTGSTTVHTNFLTDNATSTNLYVGGTLSAANVYDTGISGTTCVGETATGLLSTSNCVSSVSGTSNQITASPTTGSVVLSIPNSFNFGVGSTTVLDLGNAFFGKTSTSSFNGVGDLFVVGSTTLQKFTSTAGTTTNFAISGIANNSIVKVAQGSGGGLIAATAGTDYLTSMSFAYPFKTIGTGEQATGTALSLQAGFLALGSGSASSTLASTTIDHLQVTGSGTTTNLYSTYFLANGTTTLQNFTAQASVMANATGTNSLATVGNFITIGAAATPTYVASTSVISLNVASSTLVAGASYNRATTTIQLAPWLEARQVIGASCMATSTGGVLFQVGSKTNWTSTLFCDTNPRTYTFTAIQIAAFSNFLNVTIGAASSTADRASINVITQKVGP